MEAGPRQGPSWQRDPGIRHHRNPGVEGPSPTPARCWDLLHTAEPLCSPVVAGARRGPMPCCSHGDSALLALAAGSQGPAALASGPRGACAPEVVAGSSLDMPCPCLGHSGAQPHAAWPSRAPSCVPSPADCSPRDQAWPACVAPPRLRGPAPTLWPRPVCVAPPRRVAPPLRRPPSPEA